MAKPVSPIEAGRMLAGRYRVGPHLAGGGMAEVFLGRDERLGREVAIKVLRPDRGADPGIRRRFAAEGRSAARVSHPNVVGVYDVGEDGGSPYLIMELVTGGTLADRIGTGPPLPENVVRRVGLDILAGLGAAHAAGVLHRDVKPGNVLLGDDGTAKLADFGIAKSDQPAAGGETTATAMVIGTPSYLAPERAAGGPASVASDLWAVGVVVYEALTSVKPFQGPTPLAAALAARNGDCVPLRVRRPDVDPALAAVVERALSPDPAARHPSAAAMAEALQGLPAWGTPAGAAPTVVEAAVDPTAVELSAPTEILDQRVVMPGAVERRTRRTLAWLAGGSSVVLALVALLLAWALGGGHRPTGHLTPPTTVHARVTTTIPVPTTPPTTPPTTAAPSPTTPTHHGTGGDHGGGNGGNGGGD